jgi:hypothetical protein
MKLELTRSHALALDVIRSRLDARVAHYAARHPAVDMASHYRWTSERECRGSYRGGDGVIRIGEREVTVTLELPFLARPFKARIEDFLRRESDLVLAAG